MVRYLCNNGASISAVTAGFDDKWTVLHAAASGENLAVATYLIEVKGASKERLDKKGKSPYDMAKGASMK
jgi:ankyrin repeat protein